MSNLPPDLAHFVSTKRCTFAVKWDDKPIPGVTRISGLLRSTEVKDLRENCPPGQPRKSTGLTDFTPITIERPLGADTSFEDWANLIWVYGVEQKADLLLDQFRKPIQIEIHDESGKIIRSYKVFRCWPARYEAVSALDSVENPELVERLTLEHEGWERES
jgi:phage tail-like protein